MIKINSITKSLVCIALTAMFIGCASTQKQESAGQYVDNSVITTKVKSAIFNEDSLKTMQINVKSYKGIVQLSGYVDSAQNVITAGSVAGRIEGVTSVENNLLVK